MVSATRTPIKPGDPIWVTTPGEEQAAPGVLVRLEPGRNTATVQLLSEPAGAHAEVEISRVSYRRAGDEKARSEQPPPPPPALPAPTPAATTTPDVFDQLVALFPKVVERLQADVREGKGRRDGKKRELKAETQSYRELKKLRAGQLRRLESALRVLTRPVRTGNRVYHNWSPKQRKAAGDRMMRMNAAKAEERAQEKAAT